MANAPLFQLEGTFCFKGYPQMNLGGGCQFPLWNYSFLLYQQFCSLLDRIKVSMPLKGQGSILVTQHIILLVSPSAFHSPLVIRTKLVSVSLPSLSGQLLYARPALFVVS
jgi:hypothetical protein